MVARTLSVQAAFLDIRRGPHLFDVVELADFGAEDVHDDVSGVDQHPVTGLEALYARCAKTFILEIGNEMFADRHDMTGRATGHDHHVVAQRGFPSDVDRDDIFCFRVLKAREDQLKRAGCGIDATFRAFRDRDGNAALGVYCCQSLSFP